MWYWKFKKVLKAGFKCLWSDTSCFLCSQRFCFHLKPVCWTCPAPYCRLLSDAACLVAGIFPGDVDPTSMWTLWHTDKKSAVSTVTLTLPIMVNISHLQQFVNLNVILKSMGCHETCRSIDHSFVLIGDSCMETITVWVGGFGGCRSKGHSKTTTSWIIKDNIIDLITQHCVKCVTWTTCNIKIPLLC